MYQSFTGNARRTRQVNLSGKATNPFASASAAGSPDSAIAAAQRDRANRQRQRERVQASSRIQRVWRGYIERRRAHKAWRQLWDEVEALNTPADGAYRSEEESLRQFRKLMLFYSPRLDRNRLDWLGQRQMATASDTPSPYHEEWKGAYQKLVGALLKALTAWNSSDTRDDDTDRTTLNILAFAARRAEFTEENAVMYYDTLTSLKGLAADPLQNALLAPLHSSDAYAGLIVLLSQPLDPGLLALLKSSIDVTALSKALSISLAHAPPEVRWHLWLLGNVLCLVDASRRDYLTAIIANLLGSLSEDILFDVAPVGLDNITFDREVLASVATAVPLNLYLHEHITSLINETAIRNLLIQDESSSNDARSQILAEYALTLLRCFPRRADDIRMWLYLGPRQSSNMPATQYFWNAAKDSTAFSAIASNSRKLPQGKGDWTLILVFMELYTFVLKIMDDEEFMGAHSHGKRTGAIPVDDVKKLVTFLKNLGFILYFDASTTKSNGDAQSRDVDTNSRVAGWLQRVSANGPLTTKGPLVLFGLPGLTMDYLKGLTTGLLRAVYERDSRRHFLPKDHWLMTSRFDMTAFIPGVVAEEESRHIVQEQDQEDMDPESEDDDEDLTTSATSRPSGYASVLRQQESRARAQRKASRKRYLESVAPRLEVLQNMPFFIPFATRVEIFRQFVHLDQEKRRNGYVDPDLWRQSMMFQHNDGVPPHDVLLRHHAKIRRKLEFQDAFDQFYSLGADLKEPIQITFVDEFDIPEAGIDGGGVTKEFLTSVISQAFDPSNPNNEHVYFVENDKHLLYPNPLSTVGPPHWQQRAVPFLRSLLQQYEFLGRIIGKCLYEGILVDVGFAGFFLKKWSLTGGVNSAPMESGYRANINDVRELDEGLYRGLLALKNAPAEQVEDFGLTFVVDDQVKDDNGRTHVIEHELVPGGAKQNVTAGNRLIYLNRMAHYKLQGQSKLQTDYFLKGLSSIIQPSWLNMFNQGELQTLIGGAAADIDVADLRKNTLYGGTYVIGNDGQEHPSIQLFWTVMQSLPDIERRKVLKFVTSTPRGPLLGFSMLTPRFSIRDSGMDENRYPTTSTCVNLLKLPMYKSEKVLREKLLAAVNSGAGFDLS